MAGRDDAGDEVSLPVDSIMAAYGKALSSYRPGQLADHKPWDEAMDSRQQPRPSYAGVLDAVEGLSQEEMVHRVERLRSGYSDRGVTFSFSGEERPFPLDPIPRVIAADDWAVIERGVKQRVLALEYFLDDIYRDGDVLNEGIVPRSVVLTSPHYIRQAHGFRPVRGVRIHVSGIDLVRDSAGEFRVLEDNIRIPSGVSFVIENRQAMTRVFPDLVGDLPLMAVDNYPARLLAALQATAPATDDPTVVVLTPGVYNSAYVEHTLLARAMGVELVEGRDLVVRDGVVHMRTTQGERRVDCIYRRVDDEFLDPMHFRADSMLGVPGLLNAARFGSVTIASAVGNGVADDKLLYSYVPDLIRYYLGEEPALANVDTYRLEDPEHRAYVLSHLDELVVKPTSEAGGVGIVIGPQASEATLQRLRQQVEKDPRGWIAQPVVTLSTSPTLAGGALAPRHLDLRPFAVNDGEDIWVMPGGLTRVALREGSLVVNSSQGGGSKDTWVLATRAGRPTTDAVHTSEGSDSAGESRDPRAPAIPPAPPLPGPDETDVEQQQMQQQQVQQPVRREGDGPC
jgi:uncharacterized circularly permuted ATP-grasp superfamily protein